MVQLRIAKTSEELDAVIQLITKVYTRAGYIDARKDTQTSLSAYIGEDCTTTFIAHLTKPEILGTISVVRDTEDGLPMDIIYKEELNRYRVPNTRIGEVCQFAIDTAVEKHIRTASEHAFSELEVSTKLLGLVIHYAIQKEYQYLCFTINPKHINFYESLGCIKIGEEKQYPSVNQAPAYAYILDIEALKNEEATETKQHFLIKKIMKNPPALEFFK